jgi:hypothetical protein
MGLPYFPFHYSLTRSQHYIIYRARASPGITHMKDNQECIKRAAIRKLLDFSYVYCKSCFPLVNFLNYISTYVTKWFP